MNNNIIEDVNLLRQKSEIIDQNTDECRALIHQLIHNIPVSALGLAAPQINQFKRIFAANLSIGRFVFVNPSLKLGNKTALSTESCLSLPGIVRDLERSNKVTIQADYVVKWEYLGNHPTVMKDIDAPIKLRKRDAFIVQHEYDHLDGTLITDRPEFKEIKVVKTPSLKKVTPLSKKERLKKKKQATKARRRDKKRVEIQERFLAKEFGLFNN